MSEEAYRQVSAQGTFDVATITELAAQAQGYDGVSADRESKTIHVTISGEDFAEQYVKYRVFKRLGEMQLQGWSFQCHGDQPGQ